MSLKISKIIRSNRRTVALQIQQDGCLVIRAPFYVSEKHIQKLVFKKSSWIREKKELIERKNSSLVQKRFVEGEEFLFLGRKYKLYLSERKRPVLAFDEGFCLSKYYSGCRRHAFINWYRKSAYNKFKERVDFYISAVKSGYKKINITGAKTRWGSCSAKGSLNFSWRLVMAPAWVVDYVVAHEVAHLIEKNHSRSFWDKVKILYPDYKKSRQWLKDNGHLLAI